MPVDSKIGALTKAEADLNLVDALWGGTRKMRAAGTTYLPQEPNEEKADWEVRRDRSTLTNFFKRSISVMAGRLFEEPVTIADSSSQFEEFAEDVDLEGRNLHRFGYDLTKRALKDGLRFIVVDAPSAEGVSTKADEKAAGIRPYFIEVDVRNCLGWKTADISGQRVLTQFRMMETVTEAEDEFSEKEIKQIRVIEPNRVALYRKTEEKGKAEWKLHQEIPTSVDFVPVVPVYAGRQGFMDFEPPLMDLAWLNVAHWQSDSDQINILHVARVPILHWAGYKAAYDDSGKKIDLTIGPNSLAKSEDPQSSLTYTEHTGAAIEAGRQHGLDIEDRARSSGAEFAAPQKSGDVTATEKAIDESGDISDLSAFAQNVKDSLENALDMVGEMINQPFQGTVTMNTDLGIMTQPINIPELVKIRAMGDISREGLYETLNEEWGTTLNANDETERMSSEPPSGGGFDSGE